MWSKLKGRCDSFVLETDVHYPTDINLLLDAIRKRAALSEADKQVEYSEEFIVARHRHAAVESAINALENNGMDRCLDFGLDGFKRYVSLAVLARNIQISGFAWLNLCVIYCL